MRSERKWMIYSSMIILFALLTVYWGSSAVTTFSESAPIERKHTIIIDPGHGGIDGGATSCTGVLESNINLQISQSLNELFRFLGYQTKMTRTEDVSIYKDGDTIAKKKISDLKERVRIAQETSNGVLLSIHQNNFSDGKYSGAQIFYADTSESKAIATQLQKAFIKHLNPGSRRQEKKSAGIYLMEHITCPGVLIECGFLSNPEEELKLRSRSYQKKICCVVVSAVAEYLSNT